jgi:hypothetical protein
MILTRLLHTPSLVKNTKQSSININLQMAYIRKHAAIPVNDDSFDFEQASIEWQILSLWDTLPDCLKTTRLIGEVLQLAQASPDLALKMNLRRSENGS